MQRKQIYLYYHDQHCDTCKGFFAESHKYQKPRSFIKSRCQLKRSWSLTVQKYVFFDFDYTQDDFIECDMKYTPDMYEKR